MKKFRTRTNGLSIFIAEWNGTGRNNTRNSEVLRVWDWRSAISRAEESGTAAEAGSCGCWEYLDPKSICRGPFSNWQMQQWWEHQMLPPDLEVRPFLRKDGDEGHQQPFRPVTEVFADAPKPFAPGWMPLTVAEDGGFQTCAECGRQRLEGWSARGKWYCSNCWRKWQSY